MSARAPRGRTLYSGQLAACAPACGSAPRDAPRFGFRLSAPAARSGRCAGRAFELSLRWTTERGGARWPHERRGRDGAATARARAARGCSPRACLTFALWVALGFGLGWLAIVALPSVFGYQSLTVVSGSMVPTLGVGSVVIDEVIAPADARPGDIVTFKDPLHPRQLTHRLQKVRVEGDTFYMTTLGDANDVPGALVRAAETAISAALWRTCRSSDTCAHGSARAMPAWARWVLVLLLRRAAPRRRVEAAEAEQ